MQVILPSNHWLYQNTNFGCAYKIYTPCSSFVAYILLFALLWFKCLQCIIVFITLKAVKPISKKSHIFLIFAFSKKCIEFFNQRMSCLLAISLNLKQILFCEILRKPFYISSNSSFKNLILFSIKTHQSYFILSSHYRSVTVSKVTHKP